MDKSSLDLMREARSRHTGMLLLFRVGDFYELLGSDAETVARVCGLTLTQRAGESMAGFPHHSLDAHLRKLVGAGHRVAVCEQVTESGGAPIKRELVGTATLFD